MIEAPRPYDVARPPTPSIEWLKSPARPAFRVSSALDQVRRAPSILSAMRSVPDALRVTDEAVRAGVPAASLLATILKTVDDSHDSVVALAAVHALGRVPGPGADIELAALTLEGAPGFGEHAIWAMAGRSPSLELVGPLARAVAHGGLAGFHAQTVLAHWGATSTIIVQSALESVLADSTSADGRRYLVETIGLLPGRRAGRSLERVATDPGEPDPVRIAAIAAFTERALEPLPRAVADLTHSDGEFAAVARSVQAQRRLIQRGPRRDDRRSEGIRVAQIHLAAVLDSSVSRAGMGDAGGLATLVSGLGTALAAQQRISEIVTIGRGLPGEFLPITDSRGGRRYERIPLAPAEGATFMGNWPSVVTATRGIRSAFLASHTPDVVHLRMSDPGSLAGAVVARQLDIPIVFTLAPDPHGPIAAAEANGTLQRASFSDEDARGALWYRANLVERLARDARELVLFPRAQLRTQLEELTGIDIGGGPPRHTVVPEGIDVARAERAADTITNAASMPPVIGDLQRAISSLPKARHGLPLVVSAGRMHQIKGMARLVEAFSVDEVLGARANLVIVGGDLERPSAAEAAELSRIKSLIDARPGLVDRVVLLGHRSNDDVSLVLAAAHAGWGSLIGAHGAYTCGSAKEEFGIAIIEAMAAGLPVVAPREGGPATYVDHGRTGFVVDTADPTGLASGARNALELARDPQTASRSRSTVEESFTLERMARALAAVYRITAGASTLGQPLTTGVDGTT